MKAYAILSVVIPLVVSSAAAARGNAQIARQINLVQRRIVAFPDSFPIDGATIARSGVWALWSRSQPYLLIVTSAKQRSKIRAVMVNCRPASVAFVHGDSVVEALDSGNGDVVRVNLNARVIKRVSATRRWSQVDDAARTQRGWVISGRTDSLESKTTILADDQKLESVAQKHNDVQRGGKYVSSGGGMLLLSSLRGPFRTAIIDPVSYHTLTVQPDARALWRHDTSVTDTLRWVGLRPVAMSGGGYVQVLADLRSDIRIFVLYDSKGATVRTRSLDVPVGSLAGSAVLRRLILLRSINRQEVVEYSYN